MNDVELSGEKLVETIRETLREEKKAGGNGTL